jgi:hypothetical protein
MTNMPISRPRLALRLALAACSIPLAACTAGEGATLGAPVTVASSGGTTPTVALSPDGKTTYVAWVETHDGAQNVMLARLGAAGRREGAPVRVNSVAGDASTAEQAPPQVVTGPKGEVYVVWQKSTDVPGRMFPASDLLFAASADGGRTFGAAVTVNDDAGGLPSGHTFHNVTVGADGTVYVAWLDSRENDKARAALIAQGKLKPATPEAIAAMQAREAAGAAGKAGGDAHDGMDHGAAMAQMHHPAKSAAEASLPGSELRVATWKPGAQRFSVSVVVDRGVCPCCRTSLAAGPDGAVYVAWRKVFAGDVRDVAIARSADGGRTFTAPAAVHRDGWVFPGCPHAGPSVAVDGQGRVVVAWYTGREGKPGIFFATSADGARTFNAPTALESGDWVPPSQVKLASTPTGILAAWDDRRTAQKQVHLARLDGNSVHELTPAMNGAAPSLASSGSASGLVWQDGAAVRVRGAGTGV